MKANQQGIHSWHHKLSTFVTALVFIVVGLMFIGRNLGIIDSYWFGIIISWQMLLIVIGLVQFIKRHFWGGCILVAVGAYFLLPEISAIDTDWMATFWPVIFILIGISILFKRKPHHSHRRWGERTDYTQTSYTSEDGFIVSDNTFGSIQQIVLDPVFNGASMKCTFGGTILDLRRTKLDKPETFIEVDCTFGGIEIYVPSDWNVQTQVQAIIGGCDDKRYNSVAPVDQEHVLIIQGKVNFGGIELKN